MRAGQHAACSMQHVASSAAPCSATQHQRKRNTVQSAVQSAARSAGQRHVQRKGAHSAELSTQHDAVQRGAAQLHSAALCAECSVAQHIINTKDAKYSGAQSGAGHRAEHSAERSTEHSIDHSAVQNAAQSAAHGSTPWCSSSAHSTQCSVQWATRKAAQSTAHCTQATHTKHPLSIAERGERSPVRYSAVLRSAPHARTIAPSLT